ncbi:MAG: tRNA1(Val) (adenine(37)-N6)-methyltransferase [Clostridiales bacterium]|nr:tRNA1(Val) (adenine(37)-N6)-methyltransferase [Clostridiales bacterium]
MLAPGERLDDLHRDGLKIIQNPKFFCFGMDAVLLSDFAKVHRGQRHLDLCTGNGIIPILLSAKSKGASFAGIEIQEELADMANRSLVLNGIEDRVKIIRADIKTFGSETFDIVTANPPYMPVGHGAQSPTDALAIARHEIACTLDDVVAAAARLLVSKGRFYMVHRPARLAEIFATLATHGFAAKVLRFVQPNISRPPNLLLISSIKEGGANLVIQAPLVIYDEDGNYTKELRGIYYD